MYFNWNFVFSVESVCDRYGFFNILKLFGCLCKVELEYKLGVNLGLVVVLLGYLKSFVGLCFEKGLILVSRNLG